MLEKKFLLIHLLFFDMDYKTAIETIGKAFLEHPFVNSFMMNEEMVSINKDICYPIIVLNERNITQRVVNSRHLSTVTFNILYADVLTKNYDNELDIKSLGITVITEVLNALKRVYKWDIQDFSFNTFYGKFPDICAGSYCDVTFTMPSEIGSCDWICLQKDKCI